MLKYTLDRADVEDAEGKVARFSHDMDSLDLLLNQELVEELHKEIQQEGEMRDAQVRAISTRNWAHC
jgi:hypothetical protein